MQQQTFVQKMVTRRALSDSIKFEKPGSPEYIKLDEQIRDIDKHKFSSTMKNEPNK